MTSYWHLPYAGKADGLIAERKIHHLDSIRLTAIDIIVTTIPFKRAGSKVIFIDVINLDRDLDQLQNAIIHSENSSRSETIQLFDRNHFYYLEHPPTKEELLKNMVGKLVDDQYAPEDFLASILEREELGQTNLNNILAIPHPMSLMAFKSVVPVAVIPNGIDWGDGHLVKFVFLFSIAKQDYANTEYIYDLLLELMDQTEKQEQILSNPCFEHFMSVIENLTVVS